MLVLLSLFSTFSKKFLIEVENEGGAVEDEGGAVAEEGGDDENIDPELDDAIGALNRQRPQSPTDRGDLSGSSGKWGRK